jgi:hypothetical protein
MWAMQMNASWLLYVGNANDRHSCASIRNASKRKDAGIRHHHHFTVHVRGTRGDETKQQRRNTVEANRLNHKMKFTSNNTLQLKYEK